MRYFKSIKERDPAARHALQIILTYPGFKAMFWFRVAHFFYKIHFKLLAEIITYITRRRTGIEIHPAAKIGKRLFIDHGMGTVIGETSIIGDDCTFYHGVTLGGNGYDKDKRHPTLGNNVTVGAHAQLIGNINIGNHARIGANATVVKDVAEYEVVIGPRALPKE